MPQIISRQEIVAALTKRDGYRCTYPGCALPFDDDKHAVTIDHKFPQSKARAAGWTEEQINDLSNLQLQGKRCNAKKGDLVYLPDGTLPERRGDKAVPKAQRPELCDTCYSGRILFPGEFCPDCNGTAQPASMPRVLQRPPRECDHAKFICWACGPLGIIERKEAFRVVIEGPE